MDAVFDDIALEQIAKKQFGVDIEIDKVVARRLPVSHTAKATVFITTKQQLYCCIAAQSNLSLADVKKIITRMGFKAGEYLPPAGRPNYFDEIGLKHYKVVFPGLKPASPADLAYYRTLAPYNPALVLIGEVPYGEIRQFDTDAMGNWRVATKFTYRLIKTN